jgi:hypothetical protein
MALALFYAFFLAWCLNLVAATSSPLDLSVRTFNAHGKTVGDTYSRIRRAFAGVTLEKRKDLKGNTTLDRSWDGAVLLKMLVVDNLVENKLLTL